MVTEHTFPLASRGDPWQDFYVTTDRTTPDTMTDDERYQRAAAMHTWTTWANTPDAPLTYHAPDALSAVVAWIAGNAYACGYNPCDPQNWTTCTACEVFVRNVCPGHGTTDPTNVMVAGMYPGDGGIPELSVGHPSCVMLADIIAGPLTETEIRHYERHIDGYMWWTDPNGVPPTT